MADGTWVVTLGNTVYTTAGPMAEIVNVWTCEGWREHCTSTAPVVSEGAFPFRRITAGRFADIEAFGRWCTRRHADEDASYRRWRLMPRP
ncbi:hypothetical protein GCM10009854_27920 [Saccharopolyspora halophila]|uniref:Uncharacterized protein n=1 Tax=Saccharopolyspora halophila TaxID=405551 RepID=A0ABP5TDK4_9PSEU